MNSNQNVALPVFAGLFGCGLKFLAYNFLTTTMVLTSVGILMIYVTVFGPEMPFPQYFPFLANISVHWEGYGLLPQFYVSFTLWLLLLSSIGKGLLWLFKRMVRQVFLSEIETEPDVQEISQWQHFVNVIGGYRLLINTLVITIIFLLSFLVLPNAQLAEGTSITTMYGVFAGLYVGATISAAIYVVIDSFSERLLSWAVSQILQK